MEGRRTYLKRTGLVMLGLAASPIVAGAASARKEKKSEPSMIIDVNRCMGCHSCVIACKDHNRTPQGHFNTGITTVNNGQYPHAYQSYRPDLCHHCDDAPCVSACENGASFQLTNGIVVVDWEKCNGCGSCIEACEYDARFLDATNGNKADKCDFCVARLEHGMEPAGVETCSAGARVFGDLTKPQGEFADYLSQLQSEDPGVIKERVGKIIYTTAQKG